MERDAMWMRRIAVGLVGVGMALTLAGSTAAPPDRPFVSDAPVTDAAVRVVRARPQSAGPALGAAHAAFVDERNGFLATTGGGHYSPSVGYEGPTEPGAIQVTRDSGASWRTLWRGRRVVFDAIAAADVRHVYALGTRIPASWTCCSIVQGRSFVLASEDGGTTWRVRPAPFWVYPYPGEGGVVVQTLGRDSLVVEIDGRAARSDDGGRSWRRVAGPRGANVIRFASREVAYAGTSCVWRTQDGGRHWDRLPATCGPPVTDIDVEGSRVAVAQSWAYGNEVAARRSLVRLSLDGGSSWRAVADVAGEMFGEPKAGGWPAVTGVHFADPLHGWALSRERVQDTHFSMWAAHVTEDGGTTWREVAPLPTAFVGTTHAWAGDAGVLLRSADAGRRWRASVRPEHVSPSSPLAVRGRRLIVASAVGTLESRNGGRSWRPIRTPGETELLRLRGDLTQTRWSPEPYTTPTYIRSGSSWRRLRPPTYRGNVAAAGFTDAQHGVVADGQTGYAWSVLFATEDGGRSWRRVRIPPRVGRFTPSVVAPGIIALAATPLLYVSLDAGEHWQRFRLGNELFDCGAATLGEEAWLACGGPYGDVASVILHTADAGRSWTRLRTPFPFNRHIQPVRPGEAWTASYTSRPSLLHTHDGGRSWHQVWVAVPPHAVVR